MSMGCGNPTAVADLRPGEVVLDLGSGGGLDTILSAKRVGPNGFVWGLDYLPEMNTRATAHAAEAGVHNVEFLSGPIDDIPLPDGSVDAAISNCVVCLADDPAGVYTELARVLRPGGRIAIVDIIADDDFVRPDTLELSTCGATATRHSAVLDALTAAGFDAPSIEYTHDAAPGLRSGIVRAVKPFEPAST
jgi:ubiquinone/menaquinone biosynthesis C-methylase UbiE